MAIQFAVFIAQSLDGFIARVDGRLDWLEPFHDEEHGYAAFFAGVDALVIGRGTYDTVLGFPEWPCAKRLVVCTSRPASPRHGEELWTGTPRALAARLDQAVQVPVPVFVAAIALELSHTSPFHATRNLPETERRNADQDEHSLNGSTTALI